jgi:5-methylcytosine-specific restriction enzyme subunit McrC
VTNSPGSTQHATRATQHDTLVLQEFESRTVPLPPQAVTVLRSRYAQQIEVATTDRPGYYRVAARQHVGRLSLPGGGMLVIRPKVGVANLFYMLSAEAGLARFEQPPADLAPDPEIFSFVLALLVKQIERLLRQGLIQGYVPREEDLRVIRGRIVLSEQLRKHGDLKDRHVCAYAAFTPDIPENRVIAATLRYLPALLEPAGESTLARRTRALLAHFADISVVSRAEALRLLPRITIHRLNAGYAPVLSLCRLALHHLTLAEQAGAHPFASFLVDMPRLFESFITARLRTGLTAHGLHVVAQRRDYLDEARRVGIRPDVLVYPAGGAAPLLVLDAKYRRLAAGGESDLSRDLYQVSAYLDRYQLRRGVLVYPQFEEAAQTDLKLRGTPKHLHVATLNLAVPDLPQFEQQCGLLVEQVARLALESG